MVLQDYQKKPEYLSIRDGYGEALVEIAEADENIVGLSADLTESVRMTEFRDKFPDRFIEVGVAEQNLIGLAAGLALAGKIPFAASFAVFSPGRSWDQTRVSVCYSNLNVKLIGGHAGLSVGEDGATHQALEDIAITRVLPNMTVVVPCDKYQTIAATKAIAKHKGPSYLRLSRAKPLTITTPNTPFELGKAQTLKEGKDVTIFATGIMVGEAMLAADKLDKNGVSAQVINIHTIKPIDEPAIIQAAKQTGAVVTVEEHQIAGGLGSAVAEVLAEHQPTTQIRVGVKDTFGESGPGQELLEKYGLTSQDIVKAAQTAIKTAHEKR